MSVSETSQSASFEHPPLSGPANGTRVDPAHVIAGSVESVEKTPSTPAAEPANGAMQRVRSQAAQLAAHLQRQATSVDHREAELNSRLAAMESQVRNARLWFGEQQLEIETRQAELARREQELSEREAHLAGNAPRDRKASRGASTVDEELLRGAKPRSSGGKPNSMRWPHGFPNNSRLRGKWKKPAARE